MKNMYKLAPAIFLGFLMGVGYSLALNPFDSSDANADMDGDGLTNVEEFAVGTDPNNADSDSDGMSDGWEYEYGLDPTDPSDAHLDFDYAGGEEYASYTEVPYPYDNLAEYERGTDPTSPDTDGDGILDPDDPWPLDYKDDGTGGGGGGGDRPNPGPPIPPDQDDPDRDGLTTSYEYQIGTDPYNPDTDGDGLIDSMEILLGYDANDWDSDNDGLMDGNELGEQGGSTSGLIVDTDSDGI